MLFNIENSKEVEMFNALAYSKELEQAGFSRDQAEATINVFYRFMEHNFSTKSDLMDVKGELKIDIMNLRSELKEDIANLRSELKEDIANLRSELKEDIANLRSELKEDIASLRSDFAKLRNEFAELKYQFSSLENRMTIKFGLMQATTIGILAAIIKLF